METITHYLVGFLLAAHGWVHVVYVASSQGWLGPGEGRGWNGRSWLLSGVLDEGSILDAASVFFLLVAIGFAAGALGYVLSLDWWMPILAGSAILSTILYIVMWDGEGSGLFEKGGLGVVVDVVVLVWLFVLH